MSSSTRSRTGTPFKSGHLNRRIPQKDADDFGYEFATLGHQLIKLLDSTSLSAQATFLSPQRYRAMRSGKSPRRVAFFLMQQERRESRPPRAVRWREAACTPFVTGRGTRAWPTHFRRTRGSVAASGDSAHPELHASMVRVGKENVYVVGGLIRPRCTLHPRLVELVESGGAYSAPHDELERVLEDGCGRARPVHASGSSDSQGGGKDDDFSYRFANPATE
ncbi:hypothetical protein B0H11DRAFT_2219560 [Mycena galericulata]|nr:hypothetical protein B0H11DRAFT_2219560 [Mycena galericulata]